MSNKMNISPQYRWSCNPSCSLTQKSAKSKMHESWQFWRICMHVCVCVCERERSGECVCVFVCINVYVCLYMYIYAYMYIGVTLKNTRTHSSTNHTISCQITWDRQAGFYVAHMILYTSLSWIRNAFVLTFMKKFLIYIHTYARTRTHTCTQIHADLPNRDSTCLSTRTASSALNHEGEFASRSSLPSIPSHNNGTPALGRPVRLHMYTYSNG